MYEHVIREAMQMPWALERRYLAVVRDLLQFRARGGRFTAEELSARLAGGGERPAARPARSGNLAVIPIHGVLAHRTFEASSGMTSYDEIGAMFRRAVADEEVGTILLDVCSPGGTCVGLSELAQAIFQARDSKRIVSLVNGEMCSAAFYLGAQGHEIVSIPSAYSGSLGVWMMTEDWSEYLAKEGIKLNFINAGEHKCEDGRWWEPLPDDVRERLQDETNRIYTQFLSAVAKARGATVADVKKTYGTGRVYNATDALAMGMIDRIATVDDTIARLTGAARRRGARAVQLAAAESDSYNW